MKKTLVLRREALTDLSTDQLGAVQGGAQTGQGATCPLVRCVTGPLSYDCITYNCCTGSASC